jgi:hypothetical protein
MHNDDPLPVPMLEYLPASQLVHTVAPDSEYVPVKHKVQAKAPSALYDPALQSVHNGVPLLPAYLPAGQAVQTSEPVWL